MSFTFNAVELCVVAINEKPWARAREVCKALEYGKATKTAHVIKAHVSHEGRKEGMIELLVGSLQPLAKELAEYMSIKIYLSKEFLIGHGLAAFIRDYKTRLNFHDPNGDHEKTFFCDRIQKFF